MPPENQTVRTFIEPADSAAAMSFLGNILGMSPKETGALYSKSVAGIPLIEKPGMYEDEGRVGRFYRIDKWEGYGESFPSQKREIHYDPDYEAKLVEYKDQEFMRRHEGSVLHEALGHGLLEAVYGYQKKDHPSRSETFPYLVSVYAEILKLKKAGVPENDPYYKKHLKALKELRKMSKEELDLK